jgi:hypothetical protein
LTLDGKKVEKTKVASKNWKAFVQQNINKHIFWQNIGYEFFSFQMEKISVIFKKNWHLNGNGFFDFLLIKLKKL